MKRAVCCVFVGLSGAAPCRSNAATAPARPKRAARKRGSKPSQSRGATAAPCFARQSIAAGRSAIAARCMGQHRTPRSLMVGP